VYRTHNNMGLSCLALCNSSSGSIAPLDLAISNLFKFQVILVYGGDDGEGGEGRKRGIELATK